MIDYIVQTVKKIYVFFFIKKQATQIIPIKRKRKPKTEGEWTLRELLGSLDETYKWVGKNIGKGSWIDRDIVNAAKNLSVYNVNQNIRFSTERYDHAEYGYPTTGIVAYNGDNYKNKDGETMMVAKAIIFLKLHTFPWGIEQTNGVKYMIGCAREDKGKMYYDCAYISFDENGICSMPKQRRYQSIQVGKSRSAKKGKCKFSSVYSHMMRGDQAIINSFDESDCQQSIKKYGNMEKWLLAGFTLTLNAYIDRDAHWNITTEKAGQRVCFRVSNDNIITFFKDRLKLDTTPTGRRRTILHCVRSHIRKTGSLVKMHIRGANKFYWNGYKCVIFAPGWHGRGITEFQEETYNPSEATQRTVNLIPGAKRMGDRLMDPVRTR